MSMTKDKLADAVYVAARKQHPITSEALADKVSVSALRYFVDTLYAIAFPEDDLRLRRERESLELCRKAGEMERQSIHGSAYRDEDGANGGNRRQEP